ncbi:MAG: hypothetical protein QOH88_2220 [Verrucomicrobiota bacterium]|jgi:hypothetical protein
MGLAGYAAGGYPRNMAEAFSSCHFRSRRRAASCLLVLVVLSSFPVHAAENPPDQSTPQAVITSFFTALKANDNNSLITLLAPKRKERAADAEYLKGWLDVWRQYEVVQFLGPPSSTTSDYDEALLVPVEYKCATRPNFKDAIRVSRVGKIWYWDEN